MPSGCRLVRRSSSLVRRLSTSLPDSRVVVVSSSSCRVSASSRAARARRAPRRPDRRAVPGEPTSSAPTVTEPSVDEAIAELERSWLLPEARPPEAPEVEPVPTAEELDSSSKRRPSRPHAKATAARPARPHPQPRSRARSAASAAARSTTRRGTSSKRRCCSPTSGMHHDRTPPRRGAGTRQGRRRRPTRRAHRRWCATRSIAILDGGARPRARHASRASRTSGCSWASTASARPRRSASSRRSRWPKASASCSRRPTRSAPRRPTSSACGRERTGGELVRGQDGRRPRFGRVRRDGRGGEPGRRPRARRHRRPAAHEVEPHGGAEEAAAHRRPHRGRAARKCSS